VGKDLGIALIGAGFIGSVHARCVQENPRTHISSIYDVDRATADHLAARHAARTADSLEEAIAQADAVIIGTPADTHGDIARLCIRHTTPFMCEKPLDTDIDSAMLTARMAREANVFAGMGLNRRFDDHYRLLHQAVENGNLGNLELILMTSRTQSLPKLEYVAKSGGQLRDKGAHWFDLVCWLTDDRPAQIYVQGACLIDKRFADHGDVDTAVISMEMGRGAFCQMNFSRRTAYGYDERIEIAGSEGMMQASPPIPVNVALYRGETITTRGVHQNWYPRVQNTYPAQLDSFVDALAGNGDFPTLIDGLVAEIIAAAGNRSLKENRPIPIAYDRIEELET